MVVHRTVRRVSTHAQPGLSADEAIPRLHPAGRQRLPRERCCAGAIHDTGCDLRRPAARRGNHRTGLLPRHRRRTGQGGISQATGPHSAGGCCGCRMQSAGCSAISATGPLDAAPCGDCGWTQPEDCSVGPSPPAWHCPTPWPPVPTAPIYSPKCIASRAWIRAAAPSHPSSKPCHPMSCMRVDIPCRTSSSTPMATCWSMSGRARDQREDEAESAKVCQDSDGPAPKAAVRRYRYQGEGRWDPAYVIEARGLRNSLVLLRQASGTLLQAENSYDFAPKDPTPHDELNILKAAVPTMAGPTATTSTARRRVARLVHLSLARRQRTRDPPCSCHCTPRCSAACTTRLIARRPQGQIAAEPAWVLSDGSRILAYAVDEQGIPWVRSQWISTPGWELRPGERPAGSALAHSPWPVDGSIWLTDDCNGAVLRLSVDRP